MGLTGAGKTELAIRLFDKLPLEIISVDSAMIYQGMDIGTAKPEPEVLKEYPHHLIDILAPSEFYSAANFVEDVERLISKIHDKGKYPLLVGGTMMYFKALQQGLNTLPSSTSELKQKYNQQREQFGLGYLYQRLQSVDPDTAAKLNQNDQQRIQRALEIYELTGRPLSALLAESVPVSQHEFINLALIPEDRTRLHAQIEKRFEQMLSLGFEEEVKALHQQGIDKYLPSMRCVGYKQMMSYLNGDVDFQQMKQQAIAATRQLAKRQHTWLRRWQNLNSFDPYQKDLLESVLQVIKSESHMSK